MNMTSGTDTIRFKRDDDVDEDQQTDLDTTMNMTSGTDTIRFKRDGDKGSGNNSSDDDDHDDDGEKSAVNSGKTSNKVRSEKPLTWGEEAFVKKDESGARSSDSDNSDDYDFGVEAKDIEPSDRKMRGREVVYVVPSREKTPVPVLDGSVARFRDNLAPCVRYHVTDEDSHPVPKTVKFQHAGVVGSDVLKKLRLRGKSFDDFKESRAVVAAIKPYNEDVMNIADYNSRIVGLGVDGCEKQYRKYVTITELLYKLGYASDDVRIHRSTIGDKLYEYSKNVSNYPKITKIETNYCKEITEYSLCYGYVPFTCSSEFQVFFTRLIEKRKYLNYNYDLVEGEIELLFLGYWRLESNDIKGYDPKVTRTTKKQFLSHLLSKIRKIFNVEKNEMTKKIFKKSLKSLCIFRISEIRKKFRP
ncbi:unnamed protein product [Macrosiphum euphorbiae]|uniref:Uncharacterized protein n=1 Tax=Macrosiphum euphorbiae TaxID=13131 RepID=A0AAV0Y388_9HEMI|nr:unnamed protein product [Macrosiphum euphorbiae]